MDRYQHKNGNDTDQAMAASAAAAAADVVVRQNGERLYRVGEDKRNIFLTVSEWKGKSLIHIRRYISEDTEDEEKNWFPTSKGIALTETEFDKVMNSKGIVKKELSAIKKKKNKSAGPTKKTTKKRKQEEMEQDEDSE